MNKMSFNRYMSKVMTVAMIGGLTFASCTKDDQTDIVRQQTAKGFHLVVENSEKTSVDRQYVTWNVGDKVKINGAEAQITNSTTGDLDYTPSGAITAVYPSSAISSTFNGTTTSLALTVPSSYTYSTGASGKQILPLTMIGHAAEGAESITMYHICAAVDLNITNNFSKSYEVTSITVNSKTQNLAGVVTVSNPTTVYSGGESVPQFTLTSGGVKTVTMNCGTALTVPSMGSVRVQIPTLPFSAVDGDITVTVSGKTPSMTGATVSSFTLNFTKSYGFGVTRANVQGLNVLIAPSSSNIQGNAMFSVSDQKKVAFSKGNLQYQASSGTWSFANNQYDVLGDESANGNVTTIGRNSQTKRIDLFGWGTSGWNSGATEYQPYATSTDNSHYLPGNSTTANLTGEYVNADWGWYNAISNGGGENHTWRVLTATEWQFLLNDNTGFRGNNRYVKARINATTSEDGYAGMIIFPDNYTIPSAITLTGVNTANTAYESNIISTANWNTLSSQGCVFLPAAGYRNGAAVNLVGTFGSYWSSSASDASDARSMCFDAGYVNPMDIDNRRYGFTVRLVQEY